MNPAQPPEGILDPKQPYWPADKVGEITWLRLKGKLTGRRVEGISENFTSYVDLGDADADRLIENIKKYGKYPQVNQNDRYGGAYNNEAYQKWLVEEFLEKPFREETNKKIEEAEIERRVKEIQENKKKIANTLNNKPQPEVQPQDKLIPADPLDIPDPWEGSETVPNIITPVTTKPTLLLPPAKDLKDLEPEVKKSQQKQKRQKKEKSFIIPETLSPEIQTAIRNFSGNLDSVRRQMSKQTRILQRRERNYRKIISGLESTKFLLGQQVENSREALDDLETQQRITKAYSAPIGPQPTESPTPWASAGPEDAGNKQGFTPRLPAEKLSQGGFLNTPYPARFSEGTAGYPDTPIPGFAEGGINTASNFGKKMLQPGIYDNPTIGTLPPNSAVVPLNRNFGKKLMGQYDTQQYIQALGETMFKPINALLGGALVTLGDILRNLGPFAGYFNLGLKSLFGSLSGLLKLPVNIILDLLGGPAYTGTQVDNEETKSFYASWKAYMDKNNLFFPGGGFAPGAPGGGGDAGAGEGQDSGGPEAEWMGGLQYAPPSNPFEDTDGQETGIDISLKGKGTNGYGQGLTIRNPIDNLYYFSKVPKGFQNAGGPTRGIQGTPRRVRKGTGPGGFGHWATYYIKDNDGTFYELMIGHLDRPAPTWNDTGSGVKLNKGVKIGVQGASGSSVGNTPDGTYDHMTTHVNSPYRRNPAKSGQLLIQWAKELDAYKSLTTPRQPPIAGLEVGGEIKAGKISNLSNTFTDIFHSNSKQPVISTPIKSISTPTGASPLPKVQRITTTPIATSTKTKPKVYNIQAPQTGPSIQMIPTPTFKPQFIMIDIPTNDILESNEIRRMM
jgi:hypothetical protein